MKDKAASCDFEGARNLAGELDNLINEEFLSEQIFDVDDIGMNWKKNT